jgi:hypothetical protein
LQSHVAIILFLEVKPEKAGTANYPLRHLLLVNRHEQYATITIIIATKQR